jgi:hypothetical protein
MLTLEGSFTSDNTHSISFINPSNTSHSLQNRTRTFLRISASMQLPRLTALALFGALLLTTKTASHPTSSSSPALPDIDSNTANETHHDTQRAVVALAPAIIAGAQSQKNTGLSLSGNFNLVTTVTGCALFVGLVLV